MPCGRFVKMLFLPLVTHLDKRTLYYSHDKESKRAFSELNISRHSIRFQAHPEIILQHFPCPVIMGQNHSEPRDTKYFN